MSDNPNYWKLKGTIKKLKEKENKCFICGSTKNIVPHHIKRVKNTHDDYYSENNLVLLCDYHHHEYHKKYMEVNFKTFCEFLRDNFILRIDENKINSVKKKRGVNMGIDLNHPLKVSKLNQFILMVKEYPDLSRSWMNFTKKAIKNITPQMLSLLI